MMMRTRLWTIGFVLLAALGTRVDADTGTVVVFGTSEPRQRTVVAAAVTSVLKEARWTLVEPAFSSRDVGAIANCIGVDKPWRCVANAVDVKNLSRLFVVQADAEKAATGVQVRIVGSLLVAGHDVRASEQQFCAPCTDSDLAQSAAIVVRRLLDSASRGATTLEIHTTPAGANVTIDGHQVGSLDERYPVSAGHHKVLIELAGYRPEVRELEVPEAQVTSVNITLTPLDDRRVATHPSRTPLMLVGVGGGLVIGGIVALALNQNDPIKSPPQQQPQFYTDTRPAGVTLIVSGVAVGVAGYLWWRHTRAHTTPLIKPVTGGATVGFVHIF
jgi:hypothetical protein